MTRKQVILLVALAAFGVIVIPPLVIGHWLGKIPEPLAARPKAVADCNFPANLPPISDLPYPIARLEASLPGPVNVPANRQIYLSGSLTVVSGEDIVVDGSITWSPPDPGSGITLVSLNGDIVINGQVGGSARPPRPPFDTSVRGALAIALGQPGVNGGHIRVIAPRGSIRINGVVEGVPGSAGAWAQAEGTVPWYVRIISSRRIAAVGGQGGAGGDVVLCAAEQITIAGSALAGKGGGATRRNSRPQVNAFARGLNGAGAYARGGPGNDGGDVIFHGLGEGCQIVNSGLVRGGRGGEQERMTALALSSGSSDAEAKGSDGGRGGSIRFEGCRVAEVGIMEAHTGGTGGPADARGGTGKQSRLFAGDSGGDAETKGGDAGPDGARPRIPLITGAIAVGASC